HRPHEHPRQTAPHRPRINPSRLKRRPRRLQHQPLLRIHRQRLTRRNPEKPRIKLTSVIQKPTRTAIGLPHRIRIPIKQPLHIPTPIHREPRDHITTPNHHLPQPLRRRHPTRKPTRHPHHRHRLLNARRGSSNGHLRTTAHYWRSLL